MYNFVDTTTGQTGSKALPAEAMKYNGVYLEDEISGYQTLYVSGRELMESEVQEKEITGIDGSVYYGKTYPPRTITIGYQLIAKDNAAFRAAYNKMNQILSAEQVQIIFADEPDKYFIGTKIDGESPDGGTNAITSEFHIYCTDPKKYATTLKEFTATKNDDGELIVSIENDGSMKAHIDYEITLNAETGYLGIVSENGVMQFGKIDEADGEPYQENEQLLDLSDFIDAPDDTTGKDYMHPNYGAKGTLATFSWEGRTYLGFGTVGEIVGNANGGLRTLTLPADSNGDSDGAVNFYSYFHGVFYAGLMGQTGEMCINFLTADNKLICGCNWHKTDTVGNTGKFEWVIYNPNAKPTDGNAGRVLKTFTYQTNHLHTQNPWYSDWGHCDVLKEGERIRFFYWGGYEWFNIPEIKDMKCAKVQIACKQWGNRGGNKRLSLFGFDKFSFQKMHVDKWKDIPNRFGSGDVLTIDGDKGKFYVNGMNRQQDEILGTQYFKANPGASEIKFKVSEWTETDPTIQAYIREAWL